MIKQLFLKVFLILFMVNFTPQVYCDNLTDNSLGWSNMNTAVVTVPFTNPVTIGINASLDCALVAIPAGSKSYAGLSNNYEKITTGPNAPYQYLHVKMYRDADVGNLSIDFLARMDIAVPQKSVIIATYNASTMPLSRWQDYVLDLKKVNTTDISYYGFYFMTNNVVSTANVASNSYIDDVYLSNDATPLTTNILPITVNLTVNDIHMGVVSGEGTYIKGVPTTVNATPGNGYQFVAWNDGTSDVSKNAIYTFAPTANITLTAIFSVLSDVNDLYDATKQITVQGHNIHLQGTGIVFVYNTIGQSILTQNISDSFITLSSVGIYFVKFSSKQGVRIKKIIIY